MCCSDFGGFWTGLFVILLTRLKAVVTEISCEAWSSSSPRSDIRTTLLWNSGSRGTWDVHWGELGFCSTLSAWKSWSSAQQSLGTWVPSQRLYRQVRSSALRDLDLGLGENTQSLTVRGALLYGNSENFFWISGLSVYGVISRSLSGGNRKIDKRKAWYNVPDRDKQYIWGVDLDLPVSIPLYEMLTTRKS